MDMTEVQKAALIAMCNKGIPFYEISDSLDLPIGQVIRMATKLIDDGALVMTRMNIDKETG